MATESNCNADELANELALSLQGDLLTVPEVDLTGDKFSFDPDDQENNPLYDTPSDITLEDLTDTTLEGAGVFDVMMRAVDTHINREFKDDRITGDQYAKVYSEVMLGVLNNATNFVLTKDQTRFAAIQAQMEARQSQVKATSALVELETAKYQTAQMYYDMQNSGAGFALTKMQIANADAEHCMIKASTDKERFTVDKILPVTLAQETHKLRCLLPAQTRFAEEQVEAQRAQTLDTRTDGLTPVSGILGRQKAISVLDAETRQFTLGSLLPADLQLKNRQISTAEAEEVRITQQTESDRAQYSDTLLDGTTPVTGVISLQKKLLEEQQEQIREKIEADRAQYSDTLTDGLTQVGGVIGLQKDLVSKQILSADSDTQSKEFVRLNTLPAQLELVKEQRESERAKTLDTRTDDTTPISGSIGKQKELYAQQIDSFEKDAKQKAAKMYLDGWITQKTLDEGLLAPTELQNATVDTVLSSVRTDNGLI